LDGNNLNKIKIIMKKLITIVLPVLIFIAGCVPKFDQEIDLPDNPGIIEILVGNEKGRLPQQNAIYENNYLDTIFVKDKTADFSKVFLQGNLEEGCKIEPLDGAPKFGIYGDFSAPRKYRVTAPSGKSADWTVVLDYYVPPVGCLSDRWVGNLTCADGIWPGYSPSSCVGVKLNNDCNRVKLTFDFWDDAGAKAEMELLLGQINLDTFMGPVTLVNDVTVTSWGSVMTFHKGAAGTYNATANTLNLEIVFSGYSLPGGATKYKFAVSQKS
jgi:hypothetical protein